MRQPWPSSCGTSPFRADSADNQINFTAAFLHSKPPCLCEKRPTYAVRVLCNFTTVCSVCDLHDGIEMT